MEEISIQIPEFVDRETNVRRNYSMVLHGNKKFPSSFWPYFRHYRDNKFVDRVMNAWNNFLFKFQNSSIERQMIIEHFPWFVMETRFCVAFFGHICITIGMKTVLIN